MTFLDPGVRRDDGDAAYAGMTVTRRTPGWRWRGVRRDDGDAAYAGM